MTKDQPVVTDPNDPVLQKTWCRCGHTRAAHADRGPNIAVGRCLVCTRAKCTKYVREGQPLD